jgi:hypothetical protein
MDRNLLTSVAKWEGILFVGALAGIILLRLAQREINLDGLFWGKRKDGTWYYSPERVQAFLATIGIAMQYLLNAIHSTTGKMPDLPTASLEILGLSNAIYLGGKGWMALGGRDKTK